MSHGSKLYSPSSFGQAIRGHGFHTPAEWEIVKVTVNKTAKQKNSYSVNFDERWLQIPDDQLEIKYDPVSDSPLNDADGNYLTIKTKSRIKNEIAELTGAAYNSFLKDLFAKFEEYNKTLLWFTKTIYKFRETKESLEMNLVDARGQPLRGADGAVLPAYKFSLLDISKIAALVRSSTAVGKFYIRGTKKASRKNSKPDGFTSIYKPVRVSDSFKQIVATLPAYVKALYEKGAVQGGWSQTVNDKFQQLANRLNGGNAIANITQFGLAQKMACTNLIYIIGYLSNTEMSFEAARSQDIMRASNENGLKTITGEFEMMSIPGLEQLKARYIGGAFAAPDFMVVVMQQGVSTVNLEYSGSSQGAGGFTRPVAWVAGQQQHSILDVLVSVGQKQGKPFNVKAIPMNLVGRLLSTFILPDKIAKPVGNDALSIVGETLAVKDMLKLAHDITYADRKNIHAYRKALDKVLASKRRAENAKSKAFPKNVF